MTNDKGILDDAKERFEESEEREADNRRDALDDIKFAVLSEQWDVQVSAQRKAEGRPCMTFNHLASFLRQVVNDLRQQRPSIKVSPVGSGADQETARILSGLVRSIEVGSNAEVAYDTAGFFSAAAGFGYVRVDLDYAYDDMFDMDLRIARVADPMCVYADPQSTEADSCDWRYAFVVTDMPREVFAQKYPGADAADWEAARQAGWREWQDEDTVRVAEYWLRDPARRVILKLSDGQVVGADQYRDNQVLFDASGIKVVGEREVNSYKVTQRIITSVDVLATTPWAGRFIPIIPCYGEEVWIDGKRVLKSLIRDAKDPQRSLNFWNSTATEVVADQPRVPYIGPKGAFNADRKKWETVNRKKHAFIEYDGPVAPQRQMLDMGPAAGAIAEAARSVDELKAIIGIYDASLGARSNETSGVAIRQRQMQGNNATFHFADNLARCIRHTGRVLLDLIPSVYSADRIIRVTHDDGSSMNVPLGRPVVPQMDPSTGQPIAFPPVPAGMPAPPEARVFDLAAGKYDVVVDTGPSFATRRQEASQSMVEFIRAFPAAAPLIGDLLAKNLDWPEAETVAQRLRAALPPNISGQGLPPQIQQQLGQMQQALQQSGQQIQVLQQQLQAASVEVKNKAGENQIALLEAQLKNKELDIKAAEVQLRQTESNQRMADAAMMSGNHAQGMAQLQAQVQAIAGGVEELTQAVAASAAPRKRQGTAVKLSDGRWALEAVEMPSDPGQQPLQ